MPSQKEERRFKVKELGQHQQKRFMHVVGALCLPVQGPRSLWHHNPLHSRLESLISLPKIKNKR